MYKVECGPTVFFDCDDTLVMWDIPSDFPQENLVSITCRGHTELLAPNIHNINLLKKMATRGHGIVVWSGGGSDWCESVVKGLGIEDYVNVITGKPSYFIDDISNSKEWIGKHGYFNIDGTRVHGDNFPKQEENR